MKCVDEETIVLYITPNMQCIRTQ